MSVRRESDYLKALSHPERLRMVRALEGGERTVSELAGLLEMAQSTVSAHLAALRRSGVVVARKEGLHVHYRIADQRVRDLLALTAALAEDRR